MAPAIYVVDVGHGSCAAILAEDDSVLVDAGPSSAVLDFLEHHGVTRLSSVVISHADTDHIKGLGSLLASKLVTIGHVYANADSGKGPVWAALAYELEMLERESALQFITSIGEGDEVAISDPDTQIFALAPRKSLRSIGPGGHDHNKAAITSNTMSVVLAVWFQSTRAAVLMGDLDAVGLQHLLEVNPHLNAKVLIFPHHGGKSGHGSIEDERAFAEAVVAAVQPNYVVISNGRGVHGTPRPEIIEGVRQAGATIKIACTQLSTNCAPALPDSAPAHLLPTFSRGSEQGRCCAGTMCIDLATATMLASDAHDGFVTQAAPTALCRARHGDAPGMTT